MKFLKTNRTIIFLFLGLLINLHAEQEAQSQTKENSSMPQEKKLQQAQVGNSSTAAENIINSDKEGLKLLLASVKDLLGRIDQAQKRTSDELIKYRDLIEQLNTLNPNEREAEAQQKIQNAANLFAKAQSDYTDISLQIRDSRSKADALNQTIASLLEKMSEVQSQISLKNTENQALAMQYSDLQTRLNTSKTECLNYQTEVDKLNKIKSDLEASISQLQSQKANIQQQIAEVVKKIATFNSGRAEIKTVLVKLQEDYKNLSGEQDKLARDLMETTSNAEANKAEYDKLNANKERLSNLVQILITDGAVLKSRLETSSNSSESAKITLDSLRVRISGLKSTQKSLERQNQELGNRLNALRSDYGQKQTELKTLEAQIDTLNTQVSQARDMIEDRQKTMMNILTNIKDLQKLIDAKTSFKTTQQIDLDANKKEIDLKKTELNRLNQEASKLNNDLAKVEDELTRLDRNMMDVLASKADVTGRGNRELSNKLLEFKNRESNITTRLEMIKKKYTELEEKLTQSKTEEEELTTKVKQLTALRGDKNNAKKR